MRRKDREVLDKEKIKSYLSTAPFMSLAINGDNKYPYIVNLNYGFEFCDDDIILYFHSAKQGRKIDLMKNDNNVSVQITSKSDIVTAEDAMDYSNDYASVFLEGNVFELDNEEKKKALDVLMLQYDFKGVLEYPEAVFKQTAVYKIVCKNYTAKAYS